MVSKAKEDFPEPLNPVITINLSRGSSISMFFRLCTRAPWILMMFFGVIFVIVILVPLVVFESHRAVLRLSQIPIVLPLPSFLSLTGESVFPAPSH